MHLKFPQISSKKPGRNSTGNSLQAPEEVQPFSRFQKSLIMITEGLAQRLGTWRLKESQNSQKKKILL